MQEWLDMKAQNPGGQQRSLPSRAAARMAGHASLGKQQVHHSHPASRSCTMTCCQTAQARNVSAGPSRAGLLPE